MEKGNTEVLNAEHQKILQWLKNVKFKKVMFGGVSEQDLWKKLEELDTLYEAALIAERARYDALLETYTMSAASVRGDQYQEE